MGFGQSGAPLLDLLQEGGKTGVFDSSIFVLFLLEGGFDKLVWTYLGGQKSKYFWTISRNYVFS